MTIDDGCSHPKRLVFRLIYRDTGRIASDHSAVEIRQPEEIPFRFQCPYHECMAGGHDLTPFVQKMLEQEKSELTGRSVCRAWSQEEQPSEYLCSGELAFEISAEFE